MGSGSLAVMKSLLFITVAGSFGREIKFTLESFHGQSCFVTDKFFPTLGYPSLKISGK